MTITFSALNCFFPLFNHLHVVLAYKFVGGTLCSYPLMTMEFSYFDKVSKYRPTMSLLGPTSPEFQLKEYLDGQLQNPSWCLLTNTMYLYKKILVIYWY